MALSAALKSDESNAYCCVKPIGTKRTRSFKTAVSQLHDVSEDQRALDRPKKEAETTEFGRTFGGERRRQRAEQVEDTRAHARDRLVHQDATGP